MTEQDVEIWLPIPSLPEYRASSWGRIMRVPYTAEMPRGGTRSYGGKPIFGRWDGTRYTLFYRGKNYKVHRLICEAFSGPPPFEGAVCMHLDEDATNNQPSNLKWGTQKENLSAPGFKAYCRSRTGKRSPAVKGRARAAANAATHTGTAAV